MTQHKASPLQIDYPIEELERFARMVAQSMISIVVRTGAERHTMELTDVSTNFVDIGDWRLTLERTRKPELKEVGDGL